MKNNKDIGNSDNSYSGTKVMKDSEYLFGEGFVKFKEDYGLDELSYPAVLITKIDFGYELYKELSKDLNDTTRLSNVWSSILHNQQLLKEDCNIELKLVNGKYKEI